MSVNIYIWLARSGNGGHASLVLSSGTYLSWRSNWDKITLAKLKDDTELQKREPDLTFIVNGLDEISIQTWWEEFKRSGWSHWLSPQNSFSVIVSALRAGGADRKLSKWLRGYYKTILFWTAEKMTYYVTNLEAVIS